MRKINMIKAVDIVDALRVICLYVSIVLVMVVIGNHYEIVLVHDYQIQEFFYLIAVNLVLSVFSLLYLCKDKVKISVIDILVVLVAASCVISLLTHNPTRQILLSKTILFLSLYFNLRTVMYDGQRARRAVVVCLLASGLYQEVISILQLFGTIESNHSLFPITGSFFNPGPLGGYLSVIFGLALYCWLNERGVVKWLGAVFVPLALFLIPLTQSRIAIIAAIVCAAIVLFPLYLPMLKKWWVVSLGTILLVAGVFYMYQMRTGSVSGRVLMWKNAIALFCDNPVFGVGLSRYESEASAYQAQYFASPEGTRQEGLVAAANHSAFNEYLEIAAKLGVIGLLIMLGITFFSIKSLLVIGAGLQYSMIALCVFALASYPLSTISFWAPILLVVSYAAKRFVVFHISHLFRYVFCIIILCGALWLIVYIYPQNQTYEDSNMWIGMQTTMISEDPIMLGEIAKARAAKGEYSTALNLLQKAAQYSGDPMIYNLRGNQYLKLNLSDMAEKCYWRSYYTVPSKVILLPKNKTIV